MWAAYFPEDSEQNSSGTSSKTSSEHIFVHMCMCACIYVHVSIHTYTDDMRGHNLVGHLNKFFFFTGLRDMKGNQRQYGMVHGPCFFELKLGYSTLILILI